jgi:hypothetical protein
MMEVPVSKNEKFEKKYGHRAGNHGVKPWDAHGSDRGATARNHRDKVRKQGGGASFVAYPQGLLGGGITVGVITALAWLGVPRAGITTLLIVGSAVAAVAAVAYAYRKSRPGHAPTR